MEQNRNILFVAQIFNFRMNGNNKLFTEQPFTCIDCPLDQWLASKIRWKHGRITTHTALQNSSDRSRRGIERHRHIRRSIGSITIYSLIYF